MLEYMMMDLLGCGYTLTFIYRDDVCVQAGPFEGRGPSPQAAVEDLLRHV
jgi:hypothetical protein